MQTACFSICLTHREQEETSLTWKRPVRVTGARAILCEDLTGENPLWIHVETEGHRKSFLFHPPCGAGSRRVAAMALELPRGAPLKVWAVRAGGRGVLRVEVDWTQAMPTREKAHERKTAPAGL